MSYVGDLRKFVGHMPLQLPGSNVLVYKRNSDEVQVLLQLRSDHHKLGLLGGGLEFGESYKECAKRELREESGLVCKIEDLKLLNVYAGNEFITIHPNMDIVHHTIVLFSVPYENLKVTQDELSSETIRLEWITITALKNLLKEGEEKNFFHAYIPIIKELVEGKLIEL